MSSQDNPLIVIQPHQAGVNPTEVQFMERLQRLSLPASLVVQVRQFARMACQTCEGCVDEVTQSFTDCAAQLQDSLVALGSGEGNCPAMEPCRALLFVLDYLEYGRPLRMMRRRRSGDCAACAELPPPTGNQWYTLLKQSVPRVLGSSDLPWKWEISAIELPTKEHALSVAQVAASPGAQVALVGPLRLTARQIYQLPAHDVQDRIELMVTMVASHFAMAALWSGLKPELAAATSGADAAQLKKVAELFRLKPPTSKKHRRAHPSIAARRKGVPIHEWTLRWPSPLEDLPNRVRFAGTYRAWASLQSEICAAIT